MTRQLNQALDPRLRRLVHALNDPTRLEDLRASQVGARDGSLPEGGPSATRILVRASGMPPTDAVPQSRWTRIVDPRLSPRGAPARGYRAPRVW